MKKHVLLTLVFVFCTLCTLYAGVVNQQTAQTVAQNFYKNAAHTATAPKVSLSYTKMDTKGAVSFYVFNVIPQGFVIVSAIDNAEPVIGYSIENTFSTDHMDQIGLSDWMNTASAKIQKITEMQIPADMRITTLWNNFQTGATISNSRAGSVAPLLTTKWNQNPYYNALCPYSTTYSTNAVTGCVATAMAQIMKYWNYPATGTGSYSYNAGTYGTLSANFGATTYQWSQMPNTVTSTNYQAVALLSYHCGVAVAMDYGTIYEGGSGAYVTGTSYPSAQKAYGTYFGYNASAMKGVSQSSYTAANWAALIQGELNAGRPIQYYGYDPGGGGHTWVCDGYDANGLLHMNWGWGGYSDGYFNVDALTAGGYNFSTNDGALIGIQPSGSTPPPSCGVPSGLSSASLTTSGATVSWAAVSGAASYNLQYKTAAATTWSTLAVTSTSSTLSGLTAGTTYNYQVQTVCSSGSSAYSTASSFTTLSSCGTPSSLSSSSITTSSATLSWGTVTGATSYKLQYKSAAATTWNTVTVTSTSSNLTGLTAGTTYNFQVQSTCSSGTSSYSAASSFTTLSSCGTPGGLSATSLTTSSGTVSWVAVSGATSYKLQYKTAAATTWNTVTVSSTSSNLTGLAAATTYNYQVQSTCSGGTSAYSTASSFTTLSSCGTPTGLASTSVTTTSGTVSWVAVSGATSYKLQYKPASSSTWTTVTVTGTSSNLTGLTAGTTYNFQVQSTCTSGTSNYSVASSFVTQSLGCGVALGLSASSVTTNSAVVVWLSVVGASSYNLQYKAASATTWTTVPVTGLLYTINNLTPGTAYSFQVQTICTGGSSVYSAASSFSTLTSCGVPGSLSSSGISTNAATVSWGAVTGATSYSLQYKTAAASTWTTVTVTGTSSNLSGLAAGTTYNFQVQSTCASGNSGYSAAASFTTTSGGGGTATYCVSKGTSTMFEHIKSVAFGSFSNASGNNSGYGNYTNLTVPFVSGTAKAFTLTPGFASGAYPEYWTIFIDYNQNGAFTDAGEKVFVSGGSTAATTGSITIPAGLAGTSTMRIVMTYTAGASACGNYYFGETEDYTVSFNALNAMGDEEQVNMDGGFDNVTPVPFLYPNPAMDLVNIRLTPIEGLEQRVEIMSLTGQLVMQQIPGEMERETSFNLSELAPGVYLVRTFIGDRARTEKLIKQ